MEESKAPEEKMTTEQIIEKLFQIEKELEEGSESE